MRRLPLISATLALFCVVATPAFAQGDGAYQQAERDRQIECQTRRASGQDQSLVAGATLPKSLRSNQNVVNDWRAHNLSAPSWRAHWVQVGADYVLVEILTNRILAVRLGPC